MPLRLISYVLLVALLLPGCAKKDDPAAPAPATPANVGSYKLDGQLVTCSSVVTYEYPNRGGLGADELQIQLLTPATAQSPGGENMLLSFTKQAGGPVSAYNFMRVTHIIWPGSGSTSPQTRSFNTNSQFTLSATANGGYSGTFAATSPSFAPTAVSSSELTEGVFTNVHP